MFVSHPLIKPDTIEVRAYQKNIASACLDASTLVVLPTGLGKTVIAALVIAETLQRKGGKALFMAPTKPLVEQHGHSVVDFLNVGPVASFTGEVAPSERQQDWKGAKIVVSTPQVIANDLVSGGIDLDDVSLIIYDEAHRAVGDYAYVFIAEKYRDKGLALGITASPGSTAEKILEVCSNLGIKRVEIRKELDPDVKPYVHDIAMLWRNVVLPEDMQRVIGHLKAAFKKQLQVLQGFGLIRKGDRISVRELMAAQKTIRQRMAASSPKPSPSLFHAASTQAAALEINHALELMETQGTSALCSYLDRLDDKANNRGGSRAARTVMADEDIIKARYLAKHLTGEHPKMERVGKVVASQLRQNPDSRIIVFTHYRDTADLVTKALEKVAGCKPIRFVGQASRGEDEGLSQKEQAELLSKFRKGEFNVLVATSVGEEGLDIPSTELVVFYEPVASEIRTIQRRGRTGRKQAGKVVVMITRGTRDEAYFWSARSKERKMMEQLDILRKQLSNRITVGFPSLRETELYIEGSAAENIHKNDDEDGEEPPEPSEMPPGMEDLVDDEADDEDRVEDGNADEDGGRDSKGGRKAADSIENDRELGLERQPPIAVTRTAPPAAGGNNPIPNQLPATKGQARLFDFPAEPVAMAVPETEDGRINIIVDNREFNSEVVRELSRCDVRVTPAQLGIGDFVVSDRVGVERKEVKDFLASLMDGRLFQQVKALGGAYTRPVVIIEGEGLFTTVGGLSRESIMGALASIVTDYGVPTMFTRDERETAAFLLALAKRERGEGRTPAIRGDKGAMSLEERQQFIVEGLPNVSGTLSQRLLAHFGTIQAVFSADAKRLEEVKGIGRKSAEEITRVLTSPYLAAKGEDVNVGQDDTGPKGRDAPQRPRRKQNDGEG